MNVKKLKLIVGGFALVMATTLIMFTASPSHAQADDITDASKEMGLVEDQPCQVNLDREKGCITDCSETRKCKSVCPTDCLETACVK